MIGLVKKSHLLRCACSSRSNVLDRRTPPFGESARASHLGFFATCNKLIEVHETNKEIKADVYRR